MRVEDIVDRVVARFIGTKHERDVKRLDPHGRGHQRAWRRTTSACPMPNFKRKIRCSSKPKSQQRLGNADPAEDDYKQRLADALEPAHGSGLRAGARSGPPHAGHAPFRRAADRRHRPARRQNRRDENRRRQNARRHASRLSERAGRPRRAHRHRQRLPGPPRRRMDGPHLPHRWASPSA